MKEKATTFVVQNARILLLLTLFAVLLTTGAVGEVAAAGPETGCTAFEYSQGQGGPPFCGTGSL